MDQNGMRFNAEEQTRRQQEARQWSDRVRPRQQPYQSRSEPSPRRPRFSKGQFPFNTIRVSSKDLERIVKWGTLHQWLFVAVTGLIAIIIGAAAYRSNVQSGEDTRRIADSTKQTAESVARIERKLSAPNSRGAQHQRHHRTEVALRNLGPLPLYRLGQAYELGDGVAQDERRAFALYHLAYNAKCGAAAESISRIYASGEIVPQNQFRARWWHKQAISLGGSSHCSAPHGSQSQPSEGSPRTAAITELLAGRPPQWVATDLPENRVPSF
jgi:hypothetical protein